MSTAEFYDDVEQLADAPSHEAAERVTRGTLVTLGRHVSRGQAEELATHLPPELAEELLAESDESPEGFSVDAFVDRVRERADHPGDTERAIEAVMATFADRGARNELADARSQLPPEYEALFDVDELTPTEGVDETDDRSG